MRRPGVAEGSVRERDGQLAIRSEADVPPGVVDLVMVVHAQREQVGEIGAAAVTPPDDVMELA